MIAALCMNKRRTGRWKAVKNLIWSFRQQGFFLPAIFATETDLVLGARFSDCLK
jgi:hypothetical protein